MMDRDEQRQITVLIDHALRHDAGVPAGAIDVEADAIIRALFVRNPEAAYRVTKFAVSQSEEIERLRGMLADSLRVKRSGWLNRFFKPFHIGAQGAAE
jgi:hypothetical protein